MVGRSLFLTTSCHPMDNASARAQLLEHFLSFFLPEGILDYFELVWAESQSLDSRESKKDIIWLTPEGKSVILNMYPLVADGTRYSAEFAAFLKEGIGYDPGDKLERCYKHSLSDFHSRKPMEQETHKRCSQGETAEYVLNYFINRATNAAAESLNSKLKRTFGSARIDPNTYSMRQVQ